jgi:hypothetical protein
VYQLKPSVRPFTPPKLRLTMCASSQQGRAWLKEEVVAASAQTLITSRLKVQADDFRAKVARISIQAGSPQVRFDDR